MPKISQEPTQSEASASISFLLSPALPPPTPQHMSLQRWPSWLPMRGPWRCPSGMWGRAQCVGPLLPPPGYSRGGCVALATGSAMGLWEVKNCTSFRARYICRQSLGTPVTPELPGLDPNFFNPFKYPFLPFHFCLDLNLSPGLSYLICKLRIIIILKTYTVVVMCV